MKIKLDTSAKLLIVVFICFFLLRAFADSGVFLIYLDQARYPSIVSSFPAYTPFNTPEYTWLIHPPVQPWAINAFTLFFEDWMAAIMVAFFASIFTFFVILRILEMFEVNRYKHILALMPLTISMYQIFLSRTMAKEALFLLLFSISIYFYIRAVKRHLRFDFIMAGIAGGLCALTIDFGAYLGLIFLLGFFIFDGRKNWVNYIIPILLVGALYAPWVGVRYSIYTSNEYYPAGIGNMPEKVSDFSFLSLLNADLLPESASMFEFQMDPNPVRIIKKWGTMFTSPFGAMPFEGMPFQFTLLFLSGAIAAIGIWTIYRKFNRYDLFFILMFLIVLAPLISEVADSRFIVPQLVPVAYFILRGAGFFRKNLEKFTVFMVILLLVYTTIFVAKNPYPIFTFKKEVQNQQVIDYINTLPGDTVMAELLYVWELGYGTNKRTFTVPANPESFVKFSEMYSVNYIVYTAYLERDSTHIFDTREYIENHPEKYRLLRSIIVESNRTISGAIGALQAGETRLAYIYEIV